MIEWILGLVLAFLGIVGLFLASGAYDIGMYFFGLALFAFAVLFNFWLVKKHFDAEERAK
ncbi:MAG TPA: hypothetical protein VMU06_14810 [Stellaceae bacterium]|nr:hypothetical protein [Stellaceae bacterium]